MSSPPHVSVVLSGISLASHRLSTNTGFAWTTNNTHQFGVISSQIHSSKFVNMTSVSPKITNYRINTLKQNIISSELAEVPNGLYGTITPVLSDLSVLNCLNSTIFNSPNDDPEPSIPTETKIYNEEINIKTNDDLIRTNLNALIYRFDSCKITSINYHTGMIIIYLQRVFGSVSFTSCEFYIENGNGWMRPVYLEAEPTLFPTFTVSRCTSVYFKNSNVRSGNSQFTPSRSCLTTFSDSSFTAPSPWYSGMTLMSNPNSIAYTQLVNCHFERQSGSGDGGTLLMDYSVTHFFDCSFVDCYSPAMGGAMRTANAYNIFHRCTFRDNVAQTRGGAIRFSYPKMVYFEDCHFFDNEANEMVGGQKANHRGADIHVTSATVGMLFETQMIGCSSSSSDPRIGYYESVQHNGAPQNMDAYLPSQPTGRKAGYDMFLTLTGTDDLPAITGIVADLNADGTGLVLKVTGTGLPITGQYTITFADVVTTQVVLSGASITETDEGTCELFPNAEAKYGQTYLANVSHNEYQLSNQDGISFTVPLGPARVFSATAALNADDELKVTIHGQALTVGALYTFELVTEVDTRTYTAEATSATEIESILIPITEVDPTPTVHSVSCAIGDTLTSSLLVTLNGLNLPIGTALTVELNSTESIVFTVGDGNTISINHETGPDFEFSTEYSINSITCDDPQYTITFPNGLSFTTPSAPSTDPTVNSVSCTLGDNPTSLLVTLNGANLPLTTALTVELNSTESIVFTVGDGNTISINHETGPDFAFSSEYSINSITCDDPQYTITFPNGLSFTTPSDPTPPKRQVLNRNQTYIIQNFSPDTTIIEHSILSDDLCFTVPSTDPTVHSVSCAIGDTLTSLLITLHGTTLPLTTALTVELNSTESIVFTVGDSHTTSTLHGTSSNFEFSTEYSINSITCDDNQYTITFPNGLSFTTPSDPTPPAIVPPSLPFQPVCSSEKPCGTFTTIFAKIHDPDSTAKTSLNLVNIGYGDFADITRTFNNSVDLAGKGHVSHSPSSTRLTIDGYIVGTSGNLSVRAMVLKPSSAAVSLFTVNDPTANLRISIVRIEKLTNHVVPLFDLSEGLTYVNVSIFDTISLTKDAMISVTGSASICMSMSWLMQITRLSGTGGSCMDSYTSGCVNITYTDVAECYSTGNAGAFSHSSPGTATTYLYYNSIIFADNFGNSNPDGTKVTADLEVMGNDFVYLDYVSGTYSVLNTVRSMSEMPHYHNGQESLSVVHPSVHFYEYSVRQPVGARFEYGLPINQFKGFNASLESLVEGSDAVMFKITTSQFILIDPCVVCKHSWQVGYPKLVPQYFDRTLIECQNAGTMRLYSLQLHLNQTLTAAPFVVTDETGRMQFYTVTLFFNVTEQRAPLISCEHGYIDCWYVSLYGERGVDFVGHSMFEANGKASTFTTSNFNRVRSDVNGSVLNTLKGNVTFDRSICQNCVARYGGALYLNFEADSFLVVVHPESSAFTESFSNNVAIGNDGTVDDPMGKGGALYLKGSPTSASAIRFNNTLINHARFENNKALNGTDIFIEKSVLAPIDIATTLGFGGGSYSDFFRIVIEDREFEELVELERISLLLPTPIISVNGSVKEPLTGVSGVDNVSCKWTSSFCSTLGYGVNFLHQKYKNESMLKQYVQFIWNMTYTEKTVVLSDQDLVITGWKTSDQSKSTITRTLFVMDPLSDEGTFLVTLIKNACALFKGIDFKPTEKCGMFEVLDDAGELELNDVAFIFKSGSMYECPMIRTTLCPFTLTNVKFNTTEASSASFTTPLLYYQTNLDFTLVDVSFETLEMKSTPAVELITEGDISLQNVKFQGCTRQDTQQGKYIRVTATEFRIKRLPTLWAGCFEETQPLADFTGCDLFLGDQHEWYEASLMYYLLPPTTRIHLDNNNLEASTHPNCGSDRLVCSSIDSSYRSAKSNSIAMIELSTDAPLLKPMDIKMACTIRSVDITVPKTMKQTGTGHIKLNTEPTLVTIFQAIDVVFDPTCEVETLFDVTCGELILNTCQFGTSTTSSINAATTTLIEVKPTGTLRLTDCLFQNLDFSHESKGRLIYAQLGSTLITNKKDIFSDISSNGTGSMVFVESSNLTQTAIEEPFSLFKQRHPLVNGTQFTLLEKNYFFGSMDGVDGSLMYYWYPHTESEATMNLQPDGDDHLLCGIFELPCRSLAHAFKSLKTNNTNIVLIQSSTFSGLIETEYETQTLTSDAPPKTLTFGLTGGLSIAKSTSLVLTEINMDAESGTRTSAAITASGTVTVSQASFTSAAPVTITSALVSVTGGSFEMTGHDITNISSSASLFDVSSGSLLLDAVTVVWNGKGSTVVKQSKGTAELHTCTLSMSAVASVLYVDSLFEVSGGELLVSSLTMNGGSNKIGSLLSATGGTTHIYDVDFRESKLASSLVSGSGVVDIRKASFTQLSGQTSAANSGGTHAVSFIVRTGHVLSIGAQNDEVAFDSCTSPENGGALAVEIYGTGKLLITHTSFASCTTSGAGGALSIVCGQGVTSDSLVLKATYSLCTSDYSNHEDWIYLTGYFLSTVINPDNWEGYPDTWNSTTELYLAGEDKAKVGTAFHELTLLFYLLTYYNETIYTGAYGVDASGCGTHQLFCETIHGAQWHLDYPGLHTLVVNDASVLNDSMDFKQSSFVAKPSADPASIRVQDEGAFNFIFDENTAYTVTIKQFDFTLKTKAETAFVRSQNALVSLKDSSFDCTSEGQRSIISLSSGTLDMSRVDIRRGVFTVPPLNLKFFQHASIDTVNVSQATFNQFLTAQAGDNLSINHCTFTGLQDLPTNQVETGQTTEEQVDEADLVCSWTSGIISLNQSNTTLNNCTFSNMESGGISVFGGTFSISSSSFSNNRAKLPSFPSASRNIHCEGRGSLTINDFLNGSDGTDEAPSPWIDTGDCELSTNTKIEDSLLFVPTLNGETSSSVHTYQNKSFEVTIEGTLLMPCGLNLVAFEWDEVKQKSNKELSKTNVNLDGVKVSKWIEQTMVFVLNESELEKEIDKTYEWRARLSYGNSQTTEGWVKLKDTHALVQARKIKDASKWFVPLIIGLVVLALLALLILLIILCRRRKKEEKEEEPEVIDVSELEEDMEVDEDKQQISPTTSTKAESGYPTNATSPLQTNYIMAADPEEAFQALTGAECLDEMVEVVACDGSGETTLMKQSAALDKRLRGPRKLNRVDAKEVERQLVKGLDLMSAAAPNSSQLTTISPQTIFLSDDNQVYLKVDKKALSSNPPNTTRKEENNLNTPEDVPEKIRYEAPEVSEAKSNMDPRKAAAYSVGLVLLEMETRRVPFQDVEGPVAQQRISTGERPSMEGVSPELSKLIARCMNANPVKRPTLDQISELLN